jgi:site-specific DNA-methyltransferase (cytosine-N4-specific)
MEAVREKSLWFEKDSRADGTMHKSKGKCADGNYAIDGVFYPADGGRNLRDVWTFPTKGYSGAHFAVFPPELPERCIKAGTKAGDTVLDPFCGSGTTLLVAAKLGRKAIGYELSSKYTELIIERNRQAVLGE